jgi:hypothetical protein
MVAEGTLEEVTRHPKSYTGACKRDAVLFEIGRILVSVELDLHSRATSYGIAA